MTIHVTCECGKQLHAPDEFAGRQTRCPVCQRAVTLPAPQVAIQSEPAVPLPAIAFPEAGNPAPTPIGPPATSKLALWSLIIGLASLLFPCLLSIPAIILGILGLRAIGQNPQAVGGKGMAVTGLVAGSVTIVLGLVLGVVLILMAPMILLPAIGSSRAAATRITSTNNLKQIGIACHIHHDMYGSFPTESVGPNTPNRSKLSWRVQLLPILEENGLYSEFHQDEPWDSPHNKKLLSRMPKIYLDPRFQSEADREKGLTFYRGFVGPGGILGNSPMGVSLPAIVNANGPSQTLMVVEAGEPVPWTKPDDPSFNENGPFGGPYQDKVFLGLFADGHVQNIPQNFDRASLRKMINWMNTEPVKLP